jgi:hypothetical protein
MTRPAALEDPTAPDWTTQAFAALEELARTGEPFNASTLTARGLPNPPSPSMWGHLFKEASRVKIIRKVDFRPSTRPSRSGGSGYVWQGASA